MLAEESSSQQGFSFPPPFIVALKKIDTHIPPPSARTDSAGLPAKDSLGFPPRLPVEGPVFVDPTLLGHPKESTLGKQGFLPIYQED